jgi:ankyrin repeat protein
MPDYNLRTPISSINFNNGGVADLYEGYRMIPNENGPTRLHQAVAEGALVMVEDLLDDKICRSRINKQDDQGFTALH